MSAELALSDLVLASSDPAKAQELGGQCGIRAEIAHLLIGRGLGQGDQASSFLHPRLSALSPPDGMADRDRATERLAHAVRMKERIVVFGDYDVDGTTSAVILTQVLRVLGAEVMPFIANRFKGGYGFSAEALERVLEVRPGLIVTCDVGSSDHPRIHEAKKRGVDTIVVDHHLVPEEPLPAVAFLNPHRPDCMYPYKGLASAGLALVLAAALRKKMGADIDLRHWLDLVAVGTVADVAPLDGDNRTLVRAGLGFLSGKRVRPGLQALFEYARMPLGATCTASDIAFALAPRLNAGGRLGDSDASLALLMAENMDEARSCALRVEKNNLRRRELERLATAQALKQVEKIYGSAPQGGVVVADPAWHRGVVGIVAARLVDRLGVPSVVISLDGSEGHGSGRAPKGYRLFDALAKTASSLVRFGGHQAAAGITLRSERLEAFRDLFSSATQDVSSQRLSLQIDLVFGPGSRWDIPRASDLLLLEPMGASNDPPVCAIEGSTLVGKRVVGDSHLRFDLELPSGSRLAAFGPGLAQDMDEFAQGVSVVGTLRPDRYRGGEAVEILIKGWYAGSLREIRGTEQT